ncbi:MAG: SDR family NAD(P)-dependent oxidoreductase [Polyangiales bacterium]
MGILAKKKRILITGASRGIGREAALQLARAGHELVLAARDEAALRAVAEQCGGAEIAVMDLRDEASVRRAVAALKPVDVLVNNAALSEQGAFLQLSDAARREEMEVNYWGALRITRALLPTLSARRGSVVNVSSLIGTIASPSTSNYGASKAALEAWSVALRAEHPELTVTIFVAPHTETEMGRRVRFEGVPRLPVDYTARGLVRAIDRGSRKVAASPVYNLFLFLWRMFPRFMERQVARSAPQAFASPAPSPAASVDAARSGP